LAVRCARDRFLLVFLFIVGAAASCDRDAGERRGLPPAEGWKSPEAKRSEVEGAGGGRQQGGGDETNDPHAGMDMGGGDPDDPHAGMNMGGGDPDDPHAGMSMGGQGDPHAGLSGDQDPHANLDMGGGGGDPDMAGLQPPDPDRKIDANKFLRGTIRAGKDLTAAIKPGAVLFLSAWPVDPTTGELLGAPVAVAKLEVDKLPMKFELSERDVMVDGTRFEGDVLISARVDGDGEARTKEPGDVEGRSRARIPARGIDLVLDTALR
jgi:hypothetical protein